MAQPQPTRSQIILAPSSEPARGTLSVFLAGTTKSSTSTDWRAALCAALAHAPLTLFNPLRHDWDASWREDLDFAPFREQVQWELARQDAADVVVVYFHPEAQAPVSLLELGLAARVGGKAVVLCPEGYWKRGNVMAVCERYGAEVVQSVEGLAEAVLRRVPEGV